MRAFLSHRFVIIVFAVLLAGVALAVSPATTAAAPLQDGYVVKAGDTLNSIAARYGVSTATLARTNGIRNINRIYIGQRIVIPGRSTTPSTGSGSSGTATGGVHIVQRGDTLSRIAVRYGTTVGALMAVNGIANPDRIWVGQRIAIAKGGATAPNAPRPPATGGAGRWIDVNLSAQRLTAYQGNTPVFSALISGGLPRTPTVVGRFKVQTKLVSTRMRGPGYDLPGVPYTMYFYKGYAIHGTYWHNNFGRPMSHGCVNMRTADAAWLFNWSSIGTPVVTHW